MLGLLVDHGIGKHDPVFKSFGHTSSSDSDIAIDCIRLLKFGVRVVKNDRIAFSELVVKYFNMVCIPFFGPIGHTPDDVLVGGIIMEVEMGSLEDLEVEGPIPGFILPEQLGFDRLCKE
jgi:hypothetical protein